MTNQKTYLFSTIEGFCPKLAVNPFKRLSASSTFCRGGHARTIRIHRSLPRLNAQLARSDPLRT